MLRELVRILGRQTSKRAASLLGRLIARLWSLRQVSLSIAGVLEAGQSPTIEGTLVKDPGTLFQQDLPEVARVLAESDATSEEYLADFLDIA